MNTRTQQLVRERLHRRHIRVRGKVEGTSARPRLAVHRSSKHITAQIIDDLSGRTLALIRDDAKHGITKGTKTERATQVGEALGKKAVTLGIQQVVFDRGGRKYHGRIKAVADGARNGGLQF